MKGFVFSTAALLALAAGSAFASTMIVTAETPKGVDAPLLGGHDVTALVDNQPVPVTGWHALKGDPAGTELWILLDDGISSQVGVQLDDIRRFIRQQPGSTRVGVGYMQNGTVRTLAKPTIDHDSAAKSLRLPESIPGISASPYIALADFVHHLPFSQQPREIVLISSGIDPYYGPGPENPYLENAIQGAQKAGIPVSTIYYSSAVRSGHRFWQIDWGQNDLSQLSDETGGKFYWQGDYNPVSMQPFFDDLNERFSRQYVLSIDSGTARSGFNRLRLRAEDPQVKLIAPAQTFVGKAK